MSVYTAQPAFVQSAQRIPVTAAPYGQLSLFSQQPALAPQPQVPVVANGQDITQGQLPLLVSELSMRCATTAVTALVEQMRFDPQILLGIQIQGQIPPLAWGNVLVECARRLAPVLHAPLAEFIHQHLVSQGLTIRSGGQFPAAYSPQAGLSAPIGYATV